MQKLAINLMYSEQLMLLSVFTYQVITLLMKSIRVMIFAVLHDIVIYNLLFLS